MEHDRQNAAQLRSLLDRLSRLSSSEDWSENLNPAQAASLNYLVQANRFSRSPSHVADYLGSTRGTVSQSLKSLQQKGLISERRSHTDKRSISYDVTEEGWALAKVDHLLDRVFGQLSSTERLNLENSVLKVLRGLLQARDQREFGQCKTCRHHKTISAAPYCDLMDISLEKEEALLICHEHERGT